MTKKYDYKVLPETTKARILLALAFLGGLVVIGAYLTFIIISSWGFWSFDWLDEIEVTYVNTSDDTVAVYLDGQLELTVPAGEQVTAGYRGFEWWSNVTIEIRDLDDNLLLAVSYDKDDLKRIGYVIVIHGPP